jgi:hypothetical protein
MSIIDVIEVAEFRVKKSGNVGHAWAHPVLGENRTDLWQIDIEWEIEPASIDERLWRKKYFLQACKRLITILPCDSATVIDPDHQEFTIKKEG